MQKKKNSNKDFGVGSNFECKSRVQRNVAFMKKLDSDNRKIVKPEAEAMLDIDGVGASRNVQFIS